MVALERAWNETDSTLDGDSVGLKAVTEADAEVKAEAEALDAYSQIVSSVAERLIPSVASLRVTRTVGGGGSADGAASAVGCTRDGSLGTSAHVVAGTDRRAAACVGRARRAC